MDDDAGRDLPARDLPARDLPARDVAVRGDGIRLGQFLKLADLVDTGADAKGLLESGQVTVNGEPEARRGRQLVKGDVVRVPLADPVRVA